MRQLNVLHIERYAGLYNLPGGRVPVIDGSPRWPWEEPVARRRLQHVARLAGLSLTGDEPFHETTSNDTWLLSDEIVLRVCYRGDVDRFIREAELAAALPDSVPGPQVLDYGRDQFLSWIVLKRVHSTSLWEAWGRQSETVLRSYVAQLAEILRSLHEWQPPAQLLARYAAAALSDTETDPTVIANDLTPLSVHHLNRLIEHAYERPYSDRDVLDRIAARLAEVAGGLVFDPAEDVVLHGDYTPGNFLIQDGRVVTLLDFEWSRRGPRDIELALPGYWAWLDGQEPGSGRPRFLPWLAEFYPELFDVPDLEQRQWFYRTGFALSGLIHLPAYAPEAYLAPGHGLRQLRHLAEARRTLSL
jgi:aminoglycoside phosphotransferase (APT) family kinase protein